MGSSIGEEKEEKKMNSYGLFDEKLDRMEWQTRWANEWVALHEKIRNTNLEAAAGYTDFKVSNINVTM